MTRPALPYDYTCFADEVLHLETYAFLYCLYSEQVIVYIKQREKQAEYRQTKTFFWMQKYQQNQYFEYHKKLVSLFMVE